ncbi:outer membrane lipoprotein carrier protein LolA [Roseovarius gahaiensis]|uniref:Outer membrane lipoprotein carrier protein LolA n=1 Tax=Roseovarius gahaiensis TaxID=2716691 RepID=A0A967EFK2_9RHOB|nr:outer membrane lipoprotein carrier protein LolA [Roseovarius gahaiensis]NHQ73906.1 outer membrane lipoprotein carrier protein LolA [Roseovarius gahaiensis]
MKLFPLMIAAVACVVTALPAAADKLSLSQISSYFNGFRTAQGEFTQINDDGTISTGRLFIKRPGRVRFEYDPPEGTLVVADGDTVGIVDPKSNTGPEGYPLHRTPLKIILANKVDLSRERMVTGHASDGKTTTIRAHDPKNPEYGSIELVFTDDPVELRQWVINDDGGSQTTVVLGDLKTGMRLANDRFVIPGIGTGPKHNDR